MKYFITLIFLFNLVVWSNPLIQEERVPTKIMSVDKSLISQSKFDLLYLVFVLSVSGFLILLQVYHIRRGKMITNEDYNLKKIINNRKT